MNLKPSKTTYWFAYFPDADVIHYGVTDPGQVTMTNASEFQCGADVFRKIEKYKDKLPQARDDDIAQVGFYNYEGSIFQLKKEDVVQPQSSRKVVVDKLAAKLAALENNKPAAVEKDNVREL